MIDTRVMDKQWLIETSKSTLRGDPLLLEKVVRAFLLVENLLKSGLEFIFKGGTAVMLLLEKPLRFSIDVDILLPKKTAKNILTGFMDSVIQTGLFSSYEPIPRKPHLKLEKIHYKFFYQSKIHSRPVEDSILLDIVFDNTPYTVLNQIPLSISFLPYTGDPSMVLVPDIDNLLGDNLCTFAPKTTGIPYQKNGKSMSLEIIKQLFDIGILFPFLKNTANLKKVFLNCVLQQLAYRELKIKAEDVLEDIFQTSLCVSTQGKMGDARFKELEEGIRRIKSYIFSENYNIIRAETAASKAAYMARIIHTDSSKFVFFKNPELITGLTIENKDYNILNKLKKRNPEAFFYWYHTINFRINLR